MTGAETGQQQVFPPGFRLTSAMLWHGMLLFAILDAISLALTITVAQPADFRRMKWPIVGLAGLVWAAIWLWAIGNFWQDVYRYVFPAWSRLWIPWAQALLSAAVAGLLWWLVKRLPGQPGARLLFARWDLGRADPRLGSCPRPH